MDTLFLRDFRLELIIGIYESGTQSAAAGQARSRNPVCLTAVVPGGPTMLPIRSTMASWPCGWKTTWHNAPQPITLVESVAEHVAAIVRDEFGAPSGKGVRYQICHRARNQGTRHYYWAWHPPV